MPRRRSQLTFSSIHQTVSHGVDAPFSVAVSLSVLLGFAGFLGFGIVGLVGGIMLAVLGTRYGPRVLGMTSEAPDLVACSVCGEETVSASGLCAEHR